MLSGLRILDLSDETAFLAGKILGDLGADVVKIEPPEGDPARRRGPYLGGVEDPERSLVWLALNTSKRGVTLDLDAESGRAKFRELARGADAVIESFAPGAMNVKGLGYETLAADNPRLVYCAVTPFGQTGPYAARRGHDLIVVASGGNAAVTGDPDRPPLRCSMPTGYYHAAGEAALGVAIGLYAREDTGRGQLVDVSMQECQLQSLLSLPGQHAIHGRKQARLGPRIGRTREIWRAKDGWVTFGLRGGPARAKNLAATAEWMREQGALPDWLAAMDWKTYDHNALSAEDIARLEDAFAAFFRGRGMRALYEEALERRILLAPCNDAKEILAEPQLRFRELFVTLDYPELGASIEHPGFFAKMQGDACRIRRRAPRLGEHNAEILDAPTAAVTFVPPPPVHAGRGIFEGLRYLEFGSGAAGPVAARYFSEQGARVVRVESALRPDFLRLLALTPNAAHGLNDAPMFVLLNPNKDSIALDLRNPEAIAVAKRLAAWADVICENFSPGVMQKLGLGYDVLRALNPRLVMLSASLFGQTGPERSYPGFGGQSSAIAGFNATTGWPDREPIGPFGTIVDSLAPRYVALAITAALLERRRTERGQYVDFSQIEAAVYTLSEMVVRQSGAGDTLIRRGNRDEVAVPSGTYACRGDRFVALQVWSDEEWSALARVLGSSDARFASAAGRRKHEDDLDGAIADFTRGRDAAELANELEAAGLEACAVEDEHDLLSDPQLAHRGHFTPLPHPHLGTVSTECSGMRLSASPPRLTRAAPDLGEHTRQVLERDLGMSAAEIDRIEKLGALK
jgi:crotonobetainyl-CoA:carnitine CoA-transferase CaiB-like acyl-CoA transferase